MIVRVARFGDRSPRAIPAWLTLDAEYVVLEILFGRREPVAQVRLIGDTGGRDHGLWDLGDFDIVDGRPSRTWILSGDSTGWTLGPAAWSEPDFWDDLYADHFEARPLSEIAGRRAAALQAFDAGTAELFAEAGRPWPNAPAVASDIQRR